LNIDWQLPAEKITVSEKDQQYPLLENSDYGFVFKG
jgi:dTDP-4-dehydrorhamnose 3,5-epimerase-like enzyme